MTFNFAGSEIARFTSGGVLQIGAAVSGGGALQVNGNVNINGVFQINGTTIGGGGGSGITGSGTTNYLSKWTSASSIGNTFIYDTGSRIGVGTTTPNVEFEILLSGSYANPVLGTASGNLMLSNNGLWGMLFGLNSTTGNGWIQQMRVDSATAYNLFLQPVGGSVLITTTTSASPVFKLQVGDGSADTRSLFYSSNQYAIGIGGGTAGLWYQGVVSATGALQFYNNATGLTTISFTTANNVLIGTTTDNGSKLQVTGAATFTSSVTAAGGFFDTSDSRLKILVKDYEQPKGIENVAARMYVKNSKKELGYFAQDLQEILPSAVVEGSDGFLTLSYSQVHTAKIAYLEDKVAQLEELIKSLL